MRTCEGLGVQKLYLTGYTPYPPTTNDSRLPHIGQKLGSQIHKTALGAENTLDWAYENDIHATLEKLKRNGYMLVGLEQTSDSIALNKLEIPPKLALLLGNEVTGIDGDLIEKMDFTVEIPMKGKKESFNVIEAAAMAMYHFML